jgi:MarR family transcriptional regulator, lower aerobic nicotinate degradation pathway regulator
MCGSRLMRYDDAGVRFHDCEQEPFVSSKRVRTSRTSRVVRANASADPKPVSAVTDPRFAPTVVWYRLYTLADLISRPFLEHLSRPYGISQNDWRVLATLAYLPGSASHEVSRITGISPMNVSRSVAALRRSGRVLVTPDPRNRVRRQLTLTRKGLDLYEELLPTIKSLSKKILAPMTEEEVATLTRLIEKAIARLEELNHAPLAVD